MNAPTRNGIPWIWNTFERTRPYAYLKDVMERLPTQPANRIGELLPHRWQPLHAQTSLDTRQRAVSPLRSEPLFARKHDCFGAILHRQLMEDVVDMVAHRLGRDR